MKNVIKKTNTFSVEVLEKFNQIDSLDFELLKLKLKDSEEGEGWNSYQCDLAEMLYKRFLKLIYLYPKHRLVPSKTIDKFWHYHILDTRSYIKSTKEIFGVYIHHYPYLGLLGGDDVIELNMLFKKTLKLYLKTFNEPLIEGISSKCDSGGGGSNCAGRCYK